MLHCIAVNPAQGGSKGISKKNIRDTAGNPLLAYTILQAKKTSSVKRAFVLTDDVEIAGVAQKNGAEVVWSPEELSGDKASTESALVHNLSYLSEAESFSPDVLAVLQCRSVLTIGEDFEGTIQSLLMYQVRLRRVCCTLPLFSMSVRTRLGSRGGYS